MKAINVGFMTESWDIKKKYLKEDYTTLPNIDKKKYSEIPGLEGPFRLLSGKVIYYDPKEGKYYDRDSDIYMDYDEVQQHNTPRNEDFEQTEMELGDPRREIKQEETAMPGPVTCQAFRKNSDGSWISTLSNDVHHIRPSVSSICARRPGIRSQFRRSRRIACT